MSSVCMVTALSGKQHADAYIKRMADRTDMT
jgi:hypothetical protein